VRSTGRDSGGRLLFLNSCEDFTDAANFTVVVPRAVAEPNQSLDELERRYRGKAVRVGGTVELYRGKPQIKVSRLDQIELPPNGPPRRGPAR
jgi:hypothetical protein